MAVTVTVFWAVIVVTAEVPCTPSAAKVLRSAWMPAPPLESEPAMVSAIGCVAEFCGALGIGHPRSRGNVFRRHRMKRIDDRKRKGTGALADGGRELAGDAEHG